MSGSHELVIERLLDAPVSAVWRAWTEHLEQWWAPEPWTTRIVKLEPRPGGASILDMRGPGGEGGPMRGLFLEVVPHRRIVFTNIVDPDLMPADPRPVAIIGFFEFSDRGAETGYRAGARHWSAEAVERHAAMGFARGWDICADQLEAVARRIAGNA